MKILGEAIEPWKQRRISDPARGVVWEWTRVGTIDAIRAVEASLLPNSDYEVDETNPPMATIILRTPITSSGETSGVIQTNYELARNISQLSGWEHPRALALSQADKRTIRAALKDNSTTGISGLSGDALTFYELMNSGATAFVTSQFVFRLTQIITRNAIVNIAFDGAGEVYTTAQLKAEVNTTSTYELAIDNAYNAVLNGQYQGSIPTGRTLGWLKHAPTISTISGNRSAVSVEYWLEAATNFYYSA